MTKQKDKNLPGTKNCGVRNTRNSFFHWSNSCAGICFKNQVEALESSKRLIKNRLFIGEGRKYICVRSSWHFALLAYHPPSLFSEIALGMTVHFPCVSWGCQRQRYVSFCQWIVPLCLMHLAVPWGKSSASYILFFAIWNMLRVRAVFWAVFVKNTWRYILVTGAGGTDLLCVEQHNFL